MRAILNRINSRMTNGAALSAFIAWSDWWRECRKNRAIAAKVVMRVTKRQMLGAFSAWQQNVAGLVFEQCEQKLLLRVE